MCFIVEKVRRLERILNPVNKIFYTLLILNLAQARRELSPTYQVWINEQAKLELIEEQEEERLRIERHMKYLIVEAEAQKRWLELQEKLKRAQKEKEEQEVSNIFTFT